MTQAELKVLILWKHELQIAAKALKALHEIGNEPEPELGTPEATERGARLIAAVWEAIDACNVALYGADEDLPMVVSDIPEQHRPKRRK